MSYSTARTVKPSARAWDSVRPTMQTCGSVKMTWGAPRSSAVSRSAGRSSGRPLARAAITSPHTRAWYLPMWVSRLRPLTSPTAYSQPPGTPVARMLASTSIGPSAARPTVSRPMSPTSAWRPAADQDLVGLDPRAVVGCGRSPGRPGPGARHGRPSSPMRTSMPDSLQRFGQQLAGERLDPLEQAVAGRPAWSSPGRRGRAAPGTSRSRRARRRSRPAARAPAGRWSPPGSSTGVPPVARARRESTDRCRSPARRRAVRAAPGCRRPAPSPQPATARPAALGHGRTSPGHSRSSPPGGRRRSGTRTRRGAPAPRPRRSGQRSSSPGIRLTSAASSIGHSSDLLGMHP